MPGLGIIFHSGSYDRVYHGLSLALAAGAAGAPVRLFFTYWALEWLKKENTASGGSAQQLSEAKGASAEGVGETAVRFPPVTKFPRKGCRQSPPPGAPPVTLKRAAVNPPGARSAEGATEALRLDSEALEHKALIVKNIKGGHLRPVPELISDAKALGAAFYVCTASMGVLNIARNELADEVDKSMGITGFLAETAGYQVLFI